MYNAYLDQHEYAGIAVVGTPDKVIKKLRELYDQTGVGNLLLMMHSATYVQRGGDAQPEAVRHGVLPAIREFEKTPRRPEAAAA